MGNLVGGAIAALAGLAAVVYGFREIRRVKAAESWPTATGVVESSDVTTSRRRKGRTRYYVHVVYRFEVAGKAYSGHGFKPNGNSVSGSSEAALMQSKYAAGKTCLVHYDPDDPAECCVEMGTTSSGWILVGVGFLLCAGGAVGVARTAAFGRT